MESPNKRKGYRLLRGYVLGAIAWNVLWLSFLRWEEVPPESLWVVVIAVVLIAFSLPGVVLAAGSLYTLFWLPFNYSLLGKYARTPFPKNETPIGRYDVRARIGEMLWPRSRCTLTVYPSGLGVSLILGDVFIPKDRILYVKYTALGFYLLEHSSPEIRSPIVFRSMDVYQALEDINKGSKMSGEGQTANQENGN